MVEASCRGLASTCDIEALTVLIHTWFLLKTASNKKLNVCMFGRPLKMVVQLRYMAGL